MSPMGPLPATMASLVRVPERTVPTRAGRRPQRLRCVASSRAEPPAAPWSPPPARYDVGLSPRATRRAMVGAGGGIVVPASVVLLVAAGLLVRSFVQLTSVDPGFDSGRVLTAQVTLPQSRYQDPQAQATFFQELIAHVSIIKNRVVRPTPSTPWTRCQPNAGGTFATGCYPLAFLRFAQYAFIRFETAFLAAASMVGRFRLAFAA